MKVVRVRVRVLLGAVAVAGVGSKPTFAKLVHLYFSFSDVLASAMISGRNIC